MYISMSFFKGLGDFFALDIGTNAVRIAQLANNKGDWSLKHYAYTLVDRSVIASDSPEAKKKLGESIKRIFKQSGISEKDVVIGIPSNKTFTTVIELPNSSKEEIESIMKYQAEKYVPTSADNTKIDWAILGKSLNDETMQEVLITSVDNEYNERRLDFIESLGLNVVAAEPDPIAMVRSLVPFDNKGIIMIIDMGEQSTDIAIVHEDNPRLIRTISVGLDALIKSATGNLGVKSEQARQFILKFGLDESKLEGKVVQAINPALISFANELDKSLKFFKARYEGKTVDSVLVSGFAASVPKMSSYISSKTQIEAKIGNPWYGIQVSKDDQSKLMPVANEFSTAIGLAKRSKKQ